MNSAPLVGAAAVAAVTLRAILADSSRRREAGPSNRDEAPLFAILCAGGITIIALLILTAVG